MNQDFKERYDHGRVLGIQTFQAGCYAPFGSLYFNPLGYVGYCCQNQTETTAIGRIGRERLREIWDGRKAKAVRRAVLEYAFPQPTCQFCSWQVESGNLEGVYAKKYDHIPVSMQAPWPRYIEFALSNVCNFACTMCNGDYSTLIRSKIEKRPPLPTVYDDVFFADLERFVPHLRRASFLGGEPFLAKENYRIWDMFISAGMAERIQTFVTTNGSVFNAKVESVLEKIPFGIVVSLEGVTKQTQDDIRIGSDLDVVMENIRRFHDYSKRKGTWLTFANCLMVQNWHGFGELLRFAEELGSEVCVNVVRQPESHSLYDLPRDELERVVTQMEREQERILPLLDKNKPVLLDTVQGLRTYLDGLAA